MYDISSLRVKISSFTHSINSKQQLQQ